MKNKESDEKEIAASSTFMTKGKPGVNNDVNIASVKETNADPEKSKRTFLYLRHLILIALLKGPQTINQISINSGINWKTAENHLTHLTGKGLIALLYQTPYLKIYQLTDKGRQYLEYVKQKYQKEHIHHVDLENAENLSGVIKEFAVVWHRNESGSSPNHVPDHPRGGIR